MGGLYTAGSRFSVLLGLKNPPPFPYAGACSADLIFSLCITVRLYFLFVLLTITHLHYWLLNYNFFLCSHHFLPADWDVCLSSAMHDSKEAAFPGSPPILFFFFKSLLMSSFFSSLSLSTFFKKFRKSRKNTMSMLLRSNQHSAEVRCTKWEG